MRFSIATAAATAAALVGTVSAHAVMQEPQPYLSSPLVQVNPLDGITYKFPCQIGDGNYPETDGTAVTAGSNTPVKFTGSAVHGGGSCQFSVTYEFPPKADPSTWMVIYSIQGGCPSRAPGNIEQIGTDADGRAKGLQCGGDSAKGDGSNCVDGYDIPIPKGMKNGKATFAWTWFNNVGNREMYMNCAPITISGGSNDESFMKSLPSIFVANIAGQTVSPDQCTTADGSHVLGFPNPGEFGIAIQDFDPAGQGSCPPGQAIGTKGSPQPPSAPPSEPAPEPVPAPAPSEPAAFHPAPSPDKPTEPAPVAPAPVAPAPEKPQTTFVKQPGPSPTEAPHAPVVALPPASDAVACTNEGGIVCMGNDHFGLCNHGFAVPQMVAFGTACENGKVLKRHDMSRHMRRHLMHAAKHA